MNRSLAGHHGGLSVGLAERPGPSLGKIDKDKQSSSGLSNFFSRSSKRKEEAAAVAAALEKEQYLEEFDAASLASASTLAEKPKTKSHKQPTFLMASPAYQMKRDYAAQRPSF